MSTTEKAQQLSNNNNTTSSNSNNSNLAADETKSQSDGLSVFCREVRNLLRSKPNCMIPFSKFVPAYHNHYGRQCCVYQFGYTKLIELLESIPHVVQIIGDGTNRYITLTHREQIKRFASDLIKVVKSQPGKKLKLSQFARAYELVLGRIFRVEDYGTNNINVLLAEIWEGTINIIPIRRESVCDQLVPGPLFVNTTSLNGSGSNCNSSNNAGHSCSSSSSASASLVVYSSESSAILEKLVASNELVNTPYITDQYPDAWFEIPKRERSEKEIKRTKYFVRDVIELLSNMEPDCSVPFSKFIPSYHYYFNRQCKVSIFGFSKLIDLFESISPDVVEILDPQGSGEEKIIKLCEKHQPTRGRRDRASVAAYQRARANSTHQVSSQPSRRPRSEETSPGDSSVESSSASLSACDDEDNENDDDDDDTNNQLDQYCDADADDLILPAQAIDSGPTEEELMELEDELKAYEELKTIQSKRSSRMAAILDIFKYSIY